jgi:Skp family chaperone for outer membrane proteins
MLTNLLLLSSLINQPTNYGFLQLKNNNLDINHIILTSQNIEIEKIGIVDFRFILKKSNAMKILGDKFISLENEMNKKMKRKQVYLKNKELNIIKQKKDLSTLEYKNKIDLFKSEVLKTQKQFKEERLILNKSFQNIQNDLKDMLAKVIKNVSINKKINVVLLKENVFLYNNASIDITDEVLQIFNERTKLLKIVITSEN